jgi:hypothetical protein
VTRALSALAITGPTEGIVSRRGPSSLALFSLRSVLSLHRVLRGGCWDSDPAQLRSGYRFTLLPGARYTFVGFRVAKTR